MIMLTVIRVLTELISSESLICVAFLFKTSLFPIIQWYNAEWKLFFCE